MESTIENGVLTVALEDGFITCYVNEVAAVKYENHTTCVYLKSGAILSFSLESEEFAKKLS